jgi:hypothetical protein
VRKIALPFRPFGEETLEELLPPIRRNSRLREVVLGIERAVVSISKDALDSAGYPVRQAVSYQSSAAASKLSFFYKIGHSRSNSPSSIQFGT